MRLLIDTQILLWQIADDPRLAGGLRDALTDRSHDIVVSDATIWEIVIKNGTGRLAIDPIQADGVIDRDGYARLPVSREHIYAVGRLALHHRDPFDRLLIAQSIVENLAILTADRKFAAYPVRLAAP